MTSAKRLIAEGPVPSCSGSFLYLEKQGDPLVVEIKGDTSATVGTLAKIYFDPERCHLFSQEGKVIL